MMYKQGMLCGLLNSAKPKRTPFARVFKYWRVAILTVMVGQAYSFFSPPSVNAQDTVNPCIITNVITVCDPSKMARIKFDKIKLNKNKKTNVTVTAREELTVSTKLKYRRRGKASIITQFDVTISVPTG